MEKNFLLKTTNPNNNEFVLVFSTIFDKTGKKLKI
jgi:hypothetical protein